jgi:Rrf2 family nitric oxide-sensitive transcriptional repressor
MAYLSMGMRHTNLTDFAVRVLLYLQVAPDGKASIGEISTGHRVSQNHMDKVVQRLSKAGIVETSRGRSGGVRLARDPEDITVGDVVRAMENDMAVVECLGAARYCRVAGVCGAREVFARAVEAYLAELDSATLADIAANDVGLQGALGVR